LQNLRTRRSGIQTAWARAKVWLGCNHSGGMNV
jgi:hypothetical protein